MRKKKKRKKDNHQVGRKRLITKKGKWGGGRASEQARKVCRRKVRVAIHLTLRPLPLPSWLSWIRAAHPSTLTAGWNDNVNLRASVGETRRLSGVLRGAI